MNLRSFGILLTVLMIVVWTAAAFGAAFTDSLGRRVILKGVPHRIVSLAPSLTEILYGLGLGERIVGVTQFSNYPAEAAAKPKVGSYVNLNVEKILSLDPDLVVGTVDGNPEGVVRLLEQAGIPVYVVNPRNVREAIGTIGRVGELCGAGGRARVVSSQLLRRTEYVAGQTRKLNRPLVFLQINVRPLMTVSRDTFHHDVIQLAGGKNMSADESVTYPRVSLEEVIRKRPEVIIISSMERDGSYEEARRQWMKWPSIPAVRDRRVHLVDSDLLDRPSPRVVMGLEILARLFHPQVAWRFER
jgi:iron complex transport system substrate-binding protein